VAQAPSAIFLSTMSTAKASTKPIAAPIKPVSKAPPKTDMLSLNPQEKWFQLVQKLKVDDPIVGAKVENLLFVQIQNKQIELSLPSKLAFLQSQFQDKQFQADFVKAIQKEYGADFTYTLSQKVEGTSSQSMTKKKADD